LTGRRGTAFAAGFLTAPLVGFVDFFGFGGGSDFVGMEDLVRMPAYRVNGAKSVDTTSSFALNARKSAGRY
jgi:hypothetical protein